MTKLSRSKIELSIDCPKCFWLDLKQGIKRPQGPPFTLNNAVDFLLKEEFDVYREQGKPHPTMEKHNINAVPYQHEKLNQWRHNFTGVQYEHKSTGFLVYGAVDDVWVNQDGELIVVDYKATGAREHKIYDSYERQMAIYQWLLRRNGFKVATVGYFVFARVDKAKGFGNGTAALAFDLFVEPLAADDSWVEQALFAARKILDGETPPDPVPACDYCNYRRAAERF